MTPSLHVVAPGLLTTIQDRGRIGYQHLGVPVSGALDPVSLHAANLLVGSPPDAGALEVACMGPTLAIEADDVRIAVAGAKAAIDVLPDVAAAGGRSVAGMQSIRLRRGEVLRIGALTGATVLYVAVEGGFDIEPVLGSVSTDLRGGIGGWQGRALVAGDRLPLRLAQPSEREEVGLEGLFLRPRPRIRVITGPQHDHFSDNEVAAFLDSEYTVGPSADRMGMRLTAGLFGTAGDLTSFPTASHRARSKCRAAASRSCCSRTGKRPVAIPRSRPSFRRTCRRSRDCPWARRSRFEAVTMAAAEAARRDYVAELAAMNDKIAPLRRAAADIVPRLQECNLVSGFIDAAP
jgi:biotin-dependent carboxylase-like uncharacterized protein